MNNYFKNVLFVGPHYRQRGGMASVLEVYSKAIPYFNFISTYDNKNAVYNIFYFLTALFKFTGKLISNRNIKIIHLHSASRGSFLRKSIFILIAKIFSKKTILHIHGGEFKIFYQNSGRMRFLIRYILNTADEVLCLSDEWKSYFDLITNTTKSIVLNNPVVLPVSIKKTVPGKPVKVLYLNHITQKKGLFDVVEYFRLHQKELAGNFKLTIAGAGDTDQLLQIINKGNLNSIIEYKGWIAGKAKDELIQDCDVFILTSYNEGLPMSILESMSFGKPVIAGNVGGIPRIVRPGENGWLTAPGDIEALATVFNEIENYPGILTKYGERSLQIVQDYSPEKVNEKLDEIYTGLLNTTRLANPIL